MQSSDQPPSPLDNPFTPRDTPFDNNPDPFANEDPFGGRQALPPPVELEYFDDASAPPQYVPTYVSTPTGYELRFQLRSPAQKYVGPIVPQANQVAQLGEQAAAAVTKMITQAGRVVGTSFLTALQFAVTKFFIEWMAGMTRATIQSAADKGLPVQRIDTADIVYSPNGQPAPGSQSNQNNQGRNPADSPFGAPPRVW